MKAIDLTGRVFGRLTALEYSGQTRTISGESKRNWLCRCECGNELSVAVGALTSGNTQSCGCYMMEVRTKHGMWKDRFYQIWADMKLRCDCVTSQSYDRYGGRGINYQSSWVEFESFKLDMYPTYEDTLTLDRIDPNGNYTKDNCQWATKTAQTRNKGMNKRNKSGVTGVHEWVDSSNGTRYWVASVSGLDGKLKSKHFSQTKYGDRCFELAVAHRESMIADLNEQGAGYSPYNGKENK